MKRLREREKGGERSRDSEMIDKRRKEIDKWSEKGREK